MLNNSIKDKEAKWENSQNRNLTFVHQAATFCEAYSRVWRKSALLAQRRPISSAAHSAQSLFPTNTAAPSN